MSEATRLWVVLAIVSCFLLQLPLIDAALRHRRDQKRWEALWEARTLWGVTLRRATDYTPVGRRYLYAVTGIQPVLLGLIAWLVIGFRAG